MGCGSSTDASQLQSSIQPGDGSTSKDPSVSIETAADEHRGQLSNTFAVSQTSLDSGSKLPSPASPTIGPPSNRSRGPSVPNTPKGSLSGGKKTSGMGKRFRSIVDDMDSMGSSRQSAVSSVRSSAHHTPTAADLFPGSVNLFTTAKQRSPPPPPIMPHGLNHHQHSRIHSNRPPPIEAASDDSDSHSSGGGGHRNPLQPDNVPGLRCIASTPLHSSNMNNSKGVFSPLAFSSTQPAHNDPPQLQDTMRLNDPCFGAHLSTSTVIVDSPANSTVSEDAHYPLPHPATAPPNHQQPLFDSASLEGTQSENTTRSSFSRTQIMPDPSEVGSGKASQLASSTANDLSNKNEEAFGAVKLHDHHGPRRSTISTSDPASPLVPL